MNFWPVTWAEHYDGSPELHCCNVNIRIGVRDYKNVVSILLTGFK